jgi:hypothetical protein
MGIVALKNKAMAAFTGNPYGEFAEEMKQGSKVRDDIRDRAAYIYVTGQFPSHLRRNYMGILRAISASFQKPVALDGRSGSIKLTSEVVSDLNLENHPMVKEVRAKIDEGFLIQPSRGIQSRRPFTKVFMHRRARGGTELITVGHDGAVKRSWD